MVRLTTTNPYVIPDLSIDAIEKSIRKQIDQTERKRNAERIDLIRYYEHNSTDAYVKDYFKGTSLQQIPAFTQNFVKRAVNRRALVYKKAPKTNCNEKYQKATPGLNLARRQIERLTFLLGTLAVKTSLHRNWDDGMKFLEHDLLPIFTPLFLEGESEPVAIHYPLYNFGEARMSQPIRVVWSEARDGEKGMHFRMKGNKREPIEGNEEMLNPYDILPFTFVHRALQIPGEWWVEGATDLKRTNLQLDIAMTELALAFRFDSIGIKWIKGLTDDQKKVATGTDKFLLIPADAEIGRLEGGNMDDLVETIKFMAETALQNNHLMVKWADIGGQAKSGEALRMENIENIEERESDVEMWRKWEHERYQIDRKVLEVQGINISENEEYSVNFTEPTPPMSGEEERKQWEWEFKHGISSKEDYIRTKNPDISEEELKEKIGEVEERETKIAEKQAPKSIFSLGGDGEKSPALR